MGMVQRYVYKIYLFWFSLSIQCFFLVSLCVFVCVGRVCFFPFLLNYFFYSFSCGQTDMFLSSLYRSEWHGWGGGGDVGGGGGSSKTSDGCRMAAWQHHHHQYHLCVFHIHIARISATCESASFLQFMVKKCKFNFLQCVVILISLPLSELPMPL